MEHNTVTAHMDKLYNNINSTSGPMIYLLKQMICYIQSAVQTVVKREEWAMKKNVYESA